MLKLIPLLILLIMIGYSSSQAADNELKAIDTLPFMKKEIMTNNEEPVYIVLYKGSRSGEIRKVYLEKNGGDGTVVRQMEYFSAQGELIHLLFKQENSKEGTHGRIWYQNGQQVKNRVVHWQFNEEKKWKEETHGGQSEYAHASIRALKRHYSGDMAKVDWSGPVTFRKVEAGDVALVNGNNIMLRSTPSKRGKKVGKLQAADQVAVLEIGGEESIGNYGRHAWVRVKSTDQQIEGWIFGVFLTMAEKKLNNAHDLGKDLIGIWQLNRLEDEKGIAVKLPKELNQEWMFLADGVLLKQGEENTQYLWRTDAQKLEIKSADNRDGSWEGRITFPGKGEAIYDAVSIINGMTEHRIFYLSWQHSLLDIKSESLTGCWRIDDGVVENTMVRYLILHGDGIAESCQGETIIAQGKWNFKGVNLTSSTLNVVGTIVEWIDGTFILRQNGKRVRYVRDRKRARLTGIPATVFTVGEELEVSSRNVIFRDSPNLSSTILGKLPVGERIRILEQGKVKRITRFGTYPWYRVLLIDQEKEGWIFGAFLRKK